jgi:alpha-tubulin suppressor-like RCC1 family protein
VAIGASLACAAMDDGTARCWGLDVFGQVGDGGKSYAVGKASPVMGLSGVRSVAVGHDYSCALGADGSISCWGGNALNELGNGCFPCKLPGSAAEEEVVLTPLAVPGIDGPAVAVAGNTDYLDDIGYTCAVLRTGGVECWGIDLLGLGDGSSAGAIAPTAVPGVTSAVAVNAGIGSACALLTDGTVACFGEGALGQPGKVALSSSVSAVPVPGIAGAIGVATGDFHACALLTGGSVQCWGDNTFGSLGNGTTTDSPTPVPVSDVSGAVAIAAAGYQTCALLGDGTVRCWGVHPTQLAPVAVPGLSGGISISVGPKDACALVAGGEIECWGDNSDGQLGIGEIPDGRTTPAPVTTPRPVIAGD